MWGLCLEAATAQQEDFALYAYGLQGEKGISNVPEAIFLKADSPVGVQAVLEGIGSQVQGRCILQRELFHKQEPGVYSSFFILLHKTHSEIYLCFNSTLKWI